MKHIGEISTLEMYRLCAAQAELREAAMRFTKGDNDNAVTILYQKARSFDLALREIGIEQYWRDPFERDTVSIDTPPEMNN